MREQFDSYDPMSLSAEVGTIYSPEMTSHRRLLQAISQGASQRRIIGRRNLRVLTTIDRPDLFGAYGMEDTDVPPIAPAEG